MVWGWGETPISRYRVQVDRCSMFDCKGQQDMHPTKHMNTLEIVRTARKLRQETVVETSSNTTI